MKQKKQHLSIVSRTDEKLDKFYNSYKSHKHAEIKKHFEMHNDIIKRTVETSNKIVEDRAKSIERKILEKEELSKKVILLSLILSYKRKIRRN